LNPARHLRSVASSAVDTDEAFVRLLTETQSDLLAYVLCLVPADREAEDIVQRCNIVLWRKRGSFEPGSNFKAWAFAVARWEILAVMKERRSQSWLVFEDEVAELIGERMAGTSEDNAEGLARTESLQACLDRLSPAHRQMIIERYAEGYSVEECASRHHRSAAGLRVTLHRLRQLLRRCLSQSSTTPGK
jgi:RNA polymerase sigma-70 factor (ECF subfamily)